MRRLVRSTIDDLDRVLGVVALRRAEDERPPMPVDEIERMIEERKAAKQRRDFAEADRIRTVAGRSRRAARGWTVRHQMEEEVR